MGLDVLLLLNIFYFSTFVMFFWQLPGSFSSDKMIYKIMMIIPLCITTLFLTPRTTKNFFFLKSVALFSDDLLCEVIEASDATRDVLVVGGIFMSTPGFRPYNSNEWHLFVHLVW